MSVLKAHRSENRAEYVNTANKIYVQTINFLSRLSSRYSRLVAESVAELASEVVDNAEKASLHALENTFLNRAEMGRKNGSSPITAAPICYVRL